MKKTERLLCENKLVELQRLEPWIDAISEKWELPPAFIITLHLVLEEAFTNIVNYAYTDKEKHEIEVLMILENAVLSIQLTDDGIAFDPTLKKDPDITLPVEKREIGGLGIFLIRKLMTDVVYKRVNTKNVFTMSKIL